MKATGLIPVHILRLQELIQMQSYTVRVFMFLTLATLPLVRLITQDIVELANSVHERKQRLEMLSKERPAQGMEVYRDELEQTECDLDKDVERLQKFVDELLEIGVELRSPLDGAVYFPSEIDGKPTALKFSGAI